MLAQSQEVRNPSKESFKKEFTYYDILDGEFFTDVYKVEGEDRLDCAKLDQQARRDLIAFFFTLSFFVILFIIFSFF